MFLTPQESQEEKPPCITIPEPPRLLRLKAVNRLSIYGFWFLLGVAIANLSRLLPGGWIIYCLSLLARCGFMMFCDRDDATERIFRGKLPPERCLANVATRSRAGFALFLSCAAFWDWIVAVVNLPIHIFVWILPVWQILLLGIVGLMLLGITIGLLA